MASGKRVIVVGIDDSTESLYSLQWTIDHLVAPGTTTSSSDGHKLVLIHVKIPALSALRFSGAGAGNILTMVEADLNKTALAVVEKAKEICQKHSVADFSVEVAEGDARNVLCEYADKYQADMLVVGSHGYCAFKRAILGSVSDYCAHNAHCTVMIVKKPKTKH